jgi:hypothetical protein
MVAAVRRTGGVFTRKREGTSLRESTTVQAMPRPERLELSKPSVKADLLLVAAATALCAVIKGAIVGRQRVSCLLAVALY